MTHQCDNYYWLPLLEIYGSLLATKSSRQKQYFCLCNFNAKQKQIGCKKSARPIRSSIVAVVISDQNL